MNEGNVYLFHNAVTQLYLYVHCDNYNDAMDKFDSAGFENREEWEIFVKCGDQPQ